MAIRNTITTYGSVTKFFHWLIFLLVTFMVIFGFYIDEIPKEYRGLAFNIHKLIGLSILLLMILRLLWGLFNLKPVLPAETPHWQIFTERIVHFLLYFIIILMPISGWIGSVAGGKPPHLGAMNLDLPLAPNKFLSHFSFEVHETLALIIIGLVAIHVLAALYHEFIKKDNILRRMFP